MAERGLVLGSLRLRPVHAGWWCWLLLLSPLAWGLDPSRALDRYGHQVWRTDSGLPQNTVHAVLQTRDGYVWLGTEGGLVRFDGIDFAVFDVENTPQFPSDTVYDLFEDRAGTLWISTAAGLVSDRGGAFTGYRKAQGLPADTVWFSYQDRRQRIWAITAAGPAWLDRFDGKVFTPVAGAEAAAPVNRLAMAEDADGQLWLGGSSGVYAIRADAPAPGVALHLLSGQPVAAVVVDPAKAGRAQQVWIGTREGLACFRQGKLAPLHAPTGKAGVTALLADGANGVWAATPAGVLHVNSDMSSGEAVFAVPGVDRLYRDRQGAVWMASQSGLFRRTGSQTESFAAGSELAGSHVLAMYEDREGNLWLGTDSGGLNLLRDQKFTTYTTRDGLSGNHVLCVFQDAQGELWIGTDGAGLNRRTATGFAHLTTADGLSSNVILSLAGGADGDLWVGTPDGLNRIRRGHTKRTVERFTSADGLPDDFIRSLLTDGDGSLWIGTRHGLGHWTGGKFSTFSSSDGGSDGLGSDLIGAIFADGGNLWIGTSAGLSRRRNGVFTHYGMQQGLSNNVVTAIAASGPGENPTLWLGTNGGGLNRLQHARGEPVIEAVRAGGLPGTLYGILAGGRDNLWLSTPSGVYRVGLQPLDDFLSGQASAPQIRVLGTADGMNIRECSGGGHPAAWKLKDGSLWFSTVDGVSAIDPARAPENTVPPPVVVERVLVDDQARAADQTLTLGPGTHRLEVNYAGLSFVAPQKVRYRYRLEGFDSNWVEAGSRRAAFYTNLPPGRYRFRVVAANNDGVWNNQGASLDLRLRPHYYQTGWFYTALAMAALALGYLVYRWRVGEVEARFGAVLAERGRLAREIHDTLAQGFVGISVQLELVARLLGGSREKKEPALEHLDHARALVRESLAEARTSIWDLRAASAVDLPARLTESANRICRGSSSKVYLQVKGTYRPVSRRVEEELLRIGEEAVANAVRHGAAPRIDLQLKYEAARMWLLVSDDGCGFTLLAGARGPEGHYGLAGMQERAQQIGALLRVESEPGAGTRVSLEAPLP